MSNIQKLTSETLNSPSPDEQSLSRCAECFSSNENWSFICCLTTRLTVSAWTRKWVWGSCIVVNVVEVVQEKEGWISYTNSPTDLGPDRVRTTCRWCHDIRSALCTTSLIVPKQNYCLWCHKQQYKASVPQLFCIEIFYILLKYFSPFLSEIFFLLTLFISGGWQAWWSPVRCLSCHSPDQPRMATVQFPSLLTAKTSSRTQTSSGQVSSASWAQTRCKYFRTSSRSRAKERDRKR